MGDQARPADRSWIIPTLLNLEATEGEVDAAEPSRLVEQGLNGRGCAARASVVRVVASRILVSCQALLMLAEHFSAPLVRLLLGLTFVTGVVDAVSFLFLGRVFVANMTGNVAFVGFAAAGAAGLSAWVCLTALGGFLVGSLIGGRLARILEAVRHRWLAVALGAEAVLVGAVLVLSALGGLHASGGAGRYGAALLLAMAMGIQNATARQLAVPDLTTTVLTLTLTGLAEDSPLGTGRGTPPWRRLASVVAMLLGAFVGAALLLHASVTTALVLAAGALGLMTFVASRLSHARLQP